MLTGSIRLFVDFPLAAGAEILASAAQAHYLGTVMRRAAGETLRLFNGRDGEWAGEIAAIRRDRATLHVVSPLRKQAPEPDLWLLFAPLKRDATDLVVQKATELGASRLLPVLTERTQTARMNHDRLQAIATEAAEQCERLTVPAIDPPLRLTDRLKDWHERPVIVAMERIAAPRPPALTGPRALLVGPEGGFSSAELAWLNSLPFVVPASLGPLVLRADTAAIAGLALLGRAGCG